jgi:hypothetical protein
MSEWGVHSAMPSPMPNASCWSLHRTIAGIFSSIEHERKRLAGFATAARVGAARRRYDSPRRAAIGLATQVFDS